MIECCGNPSDTAAGGGRAVCSSANYGCPQSATPAGVTNTFVLGNPPLAALHNMTEMKIPPSAALLSQSASYAASQSSVAAAAAAAAAATHNSQSSSWCATPHGISDILGRPLCHLGLTSLNARMYLNSSAARFAAAAAAAAAGGTNSGCAKPLSTDMTSPSSVYWQSMLQPPAWRNQGQQHQPISSLPTDKDGRKKHTRPTFSGQQIFALEKTFEQTKYLAGPERARLAYALGMSESQVKVWFQNRRTKWRKKHAAEMASAKKRQEERADEIESDDDDDNDDVTDSILSAYNRNGIGAHVDSAQSLHPLMQTLPSLPPLSHSLQPSQHQQQQHQQQQPQQQHHLRHDTLNYNSIFEKT